MTAPTERLVIECQRDARVKVGPSQRLLPHASAPKPCSHQGSLLNIVYILPTHLQSSSQRSSRAASSCQPMPVAQDVRVLVSPCRETTAPPQHGNPRPAHRYDETPVGHRTPKVRRLGPRGAVDELLHSRPKGDALSPGPRHGRGAKQTGACVCA